MTTVIELARPMSILVMHVSENMHGVINQFIISKLIEQIGLETKSMEIYNKMI